MLSNIIMMLYGDLQFSRNIRLLQELAMYMCAILLHKVALSMYNVIAQSKYVDV